MNFIKSVTIWPANYTHIKGPNYPPRVDTVMIGKRNISLSKDINHQK